MAITPIHFLVAFWGEKYRHYFETCLWPSLEPQLRPEDKVIVACPTEDFPNHKDIRFRTSWVPFFPDPSKPVYWNQNEAQKAMYRWCFENKVYASMQSPDLILSQNYVATLQRHINLGYDVVQHTALRQNESTFFAEVGERRVFSPRELAGLCIRHLHRECDSLFEGDPRQPWMPPLRLWRSSGQLIIHSFVANPILMNFAKLHRLNLRCVKHIAVENIFLDKNFKGCKFGLITDSDDLSALSVSPDYPSTWHRPRHYSRFRRELGFRMAFYLWPRAGWDAFQTPSIWHSGELGYGAGSHTSWFCRRRSDPLSFLLGHLARFYLLHFKPWAARTSWIKSLYRSIKGKPNAKS